LVFGHWKLFEIWNLEFGICHLWWSLMEPLIHFDGKKCIACHSCEVSCQLENDVPAGVLMRVVKTHEKGSFPESQPLSVSTACFHCADPSCVSACPAGALHRRSDGVVEHIRSQCIGCAYCIQACPFHVPKASPAQQTMRKCSFCIQRIDDGKKPACVSKCPTGALTFFQDGKGLSGNDAYGRKEHLLMVYSLENEPHSYGLPSPVPLNTVRSGQYWKWLIGLVPGALTIAWLWKRLSSEGETND
jgi:Fe-S-cluster-containing dehydrogenase component